MAGVVVTLTPPLGVGTAEVAIDETPCELHVRMGQGEKDVITIGTMAPPVAAALVELAAEEVAVLDDPVLDVAVPVEEEVAPAAVSVDDEGYNQET